MFCKLDIFGEVPPEVTWMKGFKNLSTDPRYRIWTDGENNQAILGIESLKQEDEGAYRCCINGGEENAAEGGVEHEFSIYVTGKSLISQYFNQNAKRSGNILTQPCMPLRFFLNSR